MKYRRLGSTGLKVSVVGIGTWQFGGEWGKTFTQNEVDIVIGTAQACGVNLIDTAECYGPHLSEALIGRCIRHDRSGWVVATKFGHAFHDFMDRSQKWSAKDVKRQLDNSLKALRTDYVDLYQFHSGGDEVFDRDELWEMLTRQVQAGKVRHLGISLGSNTNVHQTESAPKKGVRAVQLVYNALDTACESAVLPLCRSLDLGVLARVPLASGFLSGKYTVESAFGDRDVRATRDPQDRERKIRRAAEIIATQAPGSVSPAQWALGFCLKHPAVTCVIPGCKNPEQVRLNAAAADLDMVGADHPQAWSDHA